MAIQYVITPRPHLVMHQGKKTNSIQIPHPPLAPGQSGTHPSLPKPPSKPPRPLLITIYLQRLAKWFTTLSPKEKAKIVKDVSQLVLARRTRMCNFLEYKG